MAGSSIRKARAGLIDAPCCEEQSDEKCDEYYEKHRAKTS